MASDRGVCWVAVGKKAEEAQIGSLCALRSYSGVPLAWRTLDGSDMWDPRLSDSQRSRLCKTRLIEYTYAEWGQTLYIDADAQARTDLSVGFDILDDGYDMVICPSLRQSSDWCWHIGDEERLEMDWCRPSCALQGGLFWVARNDRTERLFCRWQEEWSRYEGQDQGALLRALQKVPLRTWLLSQERLVDHQYGRARNGKR